MIQSQAQNETATISDTIILYGALRSGTTMLRLMLDAHPALSCPGESDFLFDHLKAERNTWQYDRRAMALDRIYRASPMELPEKVDGIPALEWMVEHARQTPESRPILVLHRHADKAFALLPNVKVIHLLRAPRDVARSAIGMGWAGNVFHGASPWIVTEDEWKVAAARHASCVHEIRYEDLVAHPEATLTDLCAFLGLAFDPGMLAYDKQSTYDKPDARLTYQWKRKLTPRQIRQVEARLGPRLQAAGYATSGLPPLRVSLPERLWLRAQDTVSTKNHLIRRYGIGNVLQRKLARVFRLHRLEATAQSRMDQITLRYLK